MTGNRIAAAALAAFAAASAAPIPLAQLDWAGVVNVFDIDSGDAPHALRVLAGVGGFATIGVLVLAVIGAVLALVDARGARAVLAGAAVAGLLTATPLWVPAAIVLGTAAYLTGRNETTTASTPSTA